MIKENPFKHKTAAKKEIDVENWLQARQSTSREKFIHKPIKTEY